MPRWQALQHYHLLRLDDAFGISLYEVSGGARILPQEGKRGGPKVIVGLFVQQQQPISPERHRARVRCLKPACKEEASEPMAEYQGEANLLISQAWRQYSAIWLLELGKA